MYNFRYIDSSICCIDEVLADCNNHDLNVFIVLLLKFCRFCLFIVLDYFDEKGF